MKYKVTNGKPKKGEDPDVTIVDSLGKALSMAKNNLSSGTVDSVLIEKA